ncbi:MAG: asparagine synthase (glutamine-hydrolyzing), partial [Coriobacteriia bacterium]|nr:asparagine synthase (glutamine-hydrolyzing) [Coriobacteriia bacterium]
MCGIAGFIGEHKDAHTILEAMTEVITHRGPDDKGFYEDQQAHLGFRRLSIIDLGQSGHQPMTNEDDSLVLTFNGEIYNYQELREELIEAGHSFKSETDSEVLLHGYEEWGADLLGRLRGMFGFAIYNTRDKSLFLARDPFGIKPIHYAQVNDNFVYASEIKSILAYPDYKKRFNARALDAYLSFQYSVPPETFFEDIYALMPAHYLLYQDGQISITRYFEVRFEPNEALGEDEAIDIIEKAFENSVEAHRIADVEVGCFLSSGVDSSYVASYFEGQKTFTVGFDFGEKYNETSWAEGLSEKIKTKQHSKIISSDEYWESIPKVQYHLDQPLADPSAIALYFVSELASKEVKVVLSGEGADELFGGYRIYHEPLDRKKYQAIVAKPVRKLLAKLAAKLPKGTKGRAFLLRGAQEVEDTFIGNAFMFDFDEKKQILRDASLAGHPQNLTKAYYERVEDYDDIVSKMQYLDLNLWMVGDILLKADRMSMAHSLELRVPFLDKEVYKVAMQIPVDLRIKGEQTKYVMRKAAERHIPSEWAQKRKLGFPVPTRVWLKEDKFYKKVQEAFTSEHANRFFNNNYLIHLLEEQKGEFIDNYRKKTTI